MTLQQYDEDITVWVPIITGAAITPNPAAAGGMLALSVAVSEEEKTLYPTYFYAGEIYCGEV